MLSVSTLCDAADVTPIIHFCLSSEGPGQPVHFTIHRHPSPRNFSHHCFMLFFLSELDSKTSLYHHDRMCSGILKHVKCLSARVAIFTQPAPLAATDVTKHPQHAQTNLESSSFYRYVACYHPLHHSSVPIFCNVSGNYE
jgi:hypothetical protein